MAQLALFNLSKIFDQSSAVCDINLDVGDGELVCLLGPSGSGKSTILRMVGGFETPTSGVIAIDGEDVTRVPPEKRPTGMVFQSHALWSHMSVAQNVAFGLKLRKLPRSVIRERVGNVLEMVGLSDHGQRRVWQLSGGQQQRVAIARSLVLEPKILLLDEPFASLDQHLRERLREEVRDIQRRVGITTLFVTHGQDEALAMADRIVVLRNGAIEQVDTPNRIYRNPQTRFVAGFIGYMNFIETEIRDSEARHPDFPLRVCLPDGKATLAIRPEALRLVPSAGALSAVHLATDFGTHVLVTVDLADGTQVRAMCPPDVRFDTGQRVSFEVDRFAVFRDGTQVKHAGDPVHVAA